MHERLGRDTSSHTNSINCRINHDAGTIAKYVQRVENKIKLNIVPCFVASIVKGEEKKYE